MNVVIKKTMLASIVASQMVLVGCASVANDNTAFTNGDQSRAAELDARAKLLDQREAELNARSGGELSAAGDLLPPNAAPGECYARVWVDAEYRTLNEEILVKEEDKQITVIPAQFETVQETVEVSAASSRIETTPAVYGQESETVLVKAATQVWRTDLSSNSAPANAALLQTAADHGINLDAATPGMCFHEHYLPATYKTISEQVLVKGATEDVVIVPAQYEMVEETVLVREASTKLIEIPAEYETVEEQVLDKPAHTVWKKGTGPIQRIDEATGEIMCLVEVPATYKTVKRTVLSAPARTETVEVPAEYKTVSVRKMVSEATETRTPIAPVYTEVERQEVDNQAGFVWHEISNTDYPSSTRTGNKICLTQTDAVYKDVARTVVVTPAQSNVIEIPAEYKQVSVTKLVAPAREEVTVIPAVYRTVEKRELLKDGYMAWRSILCETNMTRSRISDIQRSLQNAGYDIGANGVDGVIGASTIQAVNSFQRDNDLPVDKYLNIETIKALGVSVQ